jgi:hypothetical protein
MWKPILINNIPCDTIVCIYMPENLVLLAEILGLGLYANLEK